MAILGSMLVTLPMSVLRSFKARNTPGESSELMHNVVDFPDADSVNRFFPPEVEMQAESPIAHTNAGRSNAITKAVHFFFIESFISISI